MSRAFEFGMLYLWGGNIIVQVLKRLDGIIQLFKTYVAMHLNKATSAAGDQPSPPAMATSFNLLPAEIIQQIASLLSPPSLASLSQTSKFLYSHAQHELFWARFVKESVPNHPNNFSSYPYQTWKELYLSHYPYWFIPRHKIWFSDRSHLASRMTGSVIIARYDPNRACIEGYRLVAEQGDHDHEAWEWNPDVVIHKFNPKVRLWVDDPVIKLVPRPANSYKDLLGEMSMSTGASESIKSAISLCQAIPESLQDPSMALWPPAILPAIQRVRTDSQSKFRGPEHRPRSLVKACNSAFRIRKWLEMRGIPMGTRIGEDVMTFSTLSEECYSPTKKKPWQGIWVGDYLGHGCEFIVVLQTDVGSGKHSIMASRWSSQSSLVTEASTQTHGNDDAVTSDEPQDSTLQEDNTEDEPEDGSCSGRLEAIKLTGDPNVPRGEYTWVAEDIGPKGLIRIGNEQMFKGARIVRSLAHSAARDFREGWLSSVELCIAVLTYIQIGIWLHSSS